MKPYSELEEKAVMMSPERSHCVDISSVRGCSEGNRSVCVRLFERGWGRVGGGSCCSDHEVGLTMGEHIQNVRCKCQLKITRELQKVGFEGTDIFLTWQSLSGEAAHKHDGIGPVRPLAECHC